MVNLRVFYLVFLYICLTSLGGDTQQLNLLLQPGVVHDVDNVI